MTQYLRLRTPPTSVHVPGDAQARLDSRLQTPLKYLWASRESLATERLSLGGELLRYGMSEWSGAKAPLHAVDAIGPGPDGQALAHWATQHATDDDGRVTCPVLVCDDIRVAAGVLDALRSDLSRGAVVVGTPDPRTPLPFGSRSRSSASMALLLPGTSASHIAWLGAEDDHPAFERCLAVCALKQGLTSDSIPYYLRATEVALRRQHCAEAWLIVFVDSLMPDSRTTPRLEVDVLAATLGWFATFDSARGIVLLSVPGPKRVAHDWNCGEVARHLGRSMARRNVVASLSGMAR